MSISGRLRSLVFHALRMGFRLTPMSAARRDRLRQRFLTRHAGLVPVGPRGRDAQGVDRRPRVHAAQRLIDYLPRIDAALPNPLPATIVAFYLPQFHPIPENDAWWGKGFTEWANVTRALPQFEGHIQPRLPGDLGFYDLRLTDTLREQAELARAYGVGAFCMYFYWFGGTTLLETPLRHWLDDPSMDMPLCLCWANENWSRRWDGRDDDLLIGQAHSPRDDLDFIAHVARYLRDDRYLRVDGKPMLLVYRPGLLPDARATAERWRAWCRENGVGDIHLAYVQSFDNVDPHDIGFDAAVSFPPNNTRLQPVTQRRTLINPAYVGEIFDWRDLTQERKDPAYLLYPAVNPGWDNEARRSGRGRTYVHASPAGYAAWLRRNIATARRRAPSTPLVFVNAWNEWAEGAVLEPDAARGYAWLAATRAALSPLPARPKPVALVHVWHVELFEGIVTALYKTGIDWRLIVTTVGERESAVRDECARLGLHAEVIVGDNRGRDVLPFLRTLSTLLVDGSQILLKLHTKKTEHRSDGDRWRDELLDALISHDRATRLLDAFASDSTLGAIAPDAHALPLGDFEGANAAAVKALALRLGAPAARETRFIAGSMFWARVDALRPLLEMDLAEWEFEDEAGQVDGTLAHAVERVIALAVTEAGFRTEEAQHLLGESPRIAFTYATRSRDSTM